MRAALPPASAVTLTSSASIVIHAGFVVTGIVNTIIGPLLPILIARWSLSDQRAGLYFTALFVGSMLGVASFRALIAKGYRTAFGVGFLLIAAGMAALNAPSNLGSMMATTVFGCGLGLAISATNLWGAEVAQEARLAAVSFLNFVWGLGAISCPPLVMISQRYQRLPEFLCAVAASAAITALLLSRMSVEPQSHSEAPHSRTSASNQISIGGAICLAAMFYLYVGSESSISGWVAGLAKRVNPASAGDLWALAPMFFWGGLLAGRGLVPLIPYRRHERALVFIGIVWAAVWIILLSRATTYAAVVACAGVAALGFAAVYPVLIAWLVKMFGEKSRRIGALMFALANLGGAMMPWLVGFTSTHAASLRTGLLVPLTACAAMLVTLALMREEIFRGTAPN